MADRIFSAYDSQRCRVIDIRLTERCANPANAVEVRETSAGFETTAEAIDVRFKFTLT